MTQPQQRQVTRAFSHQNENSELFRVEAPCKRHLRWMRDALPASHDTAASAQVDFCHASSMLSTASEHRHYANTKTPFPVIQAKYT